MKIDEKNRLLRKKSRKTVVSKSGFRKRLESVLACIIVFTVTYSLILPAITLEYSNTDSVGMVMEEAYDVSAEQENADSGFDDFSVDSFVSEDGGALIPASSDFDEQEAAAGQSEEADEETADLPAEEDEEAASEEIFAAGPVFIKGMTIQSL